MQSSSQVNLSSSVVPVVYIRSKFPFSEYALYLDIYQSLGNTFSERPIRILEWQRRISSLLAARGVEMVILDDAHSVGVSHHIPTDSMAAINSLSKSANVTVVLVGNEQIREMVEEHAEYARRFPRIQIHRFKFDEDFVKFLHSLDEQIELPVNLSNQELAGVLYSLSEGLIGILMPLIQLALRKIVIENSFERLSLDHFVHALLEAKEALCIRQ
nr:TniB family NTP-binding protein [Alicyclobacillus mengziensis]